MIINSAVIDRQQGRECRKQNRKWTLNWEKQKRSRENKRSCPIKWTSFCSTRIIYRHVLISTFFFIKIRQESNSIVQWSIDKNRTTKRSLERMNYGTIRKQTYTSNSNTSYEYEIHRLCQEQILKQRQRQSSHLVSCRYSKKN